MSRGTDYLCRRLKGYLNMNAKSLDNGQDFGISVLVYVGSLSRIVPIISHPTELPADGWAKYT